MIKIENAEVVGWEPAIRGMRNPMNSWDRSDSGMCCDVSCRDCVYYREHGKCTNDTSETEFVLGVNDRKLANSLAKGGSVHAKYRRMIIIYLDITAPLYWWKEFDTYVVGTVKNSCSTMHKIHDKEFVLADFSLEHLFGRIDDGLIKKDSPLGILRETVAVLNTYREAYLETKNKDYWWQMIQLLPSSYNQRRTVMLNYEVIDNIRRHRSNHKLDEWREFCLWTDTLPYIDDICPKGEKE